MVKQTVKYPNHEILYSNKRESTTDSRDNLYESPKDYDEWKKRPISKSYILYDSTYLTFLKLQNYRNEEKISSYQELRRGVEMGRKWV